eukprot:1729026-Rhodomonas_salina.2
MGRKVGGMVPGACLCTTAGPVLQCPVSPHRSGGGFAGKLSKNANRTTPFARNNNNKRCDSHDTALPSQQQQP